MQIYNKTNIIVCLYHVVTHYIHSKIRKLQIIQNSSPCITTGCIHNTNIDISMTAKKSYTHTKEFTYNKSDTNHPTHPLKKHTTSRQNKQTAFYNCKYSTHIMIWYMFIHNNYMLVLHNLLYTLYVRTL